MRARVQGAEPRMCVNMCGCAHGTRSNVVLLRYDLITGANGTASKMYVSALSAGGPQARQRCSLCGQEDRPAQPVPIHQRCSRLSKLAPALMYERAAG